MVLVLAVVHYGACSACSRRQLPLTVSLNIRPIRQAPDPFSSQEMLSLSEKGDNATVDMLVGDIYGQDYGKLGLKSTTIASSFGKVFKKGAEKRTFSAEDISKSLLYAVSNNIGQIAYVFVCMSTS